MRSILAAALIALTVFLPGNAARAKSGANPALSSSGLSPLARKYAVKREALVREFAAKRRVLVDSPGWRTMSSQKQEAELDALVAGLKARDEKLTAEYDAERRRGKGGEAAAAARDERERQSRLDQLRIDAAQDALRARKAP
jgi:hypothetical protein